MTCMQEVTAFVSELSWRSVLIAGCIGFVWGFSVRLADDTVKLIFGGRK